jgi:hypothetical protein
MTRIAFALRRLGGVAVVCLAVALTGCGGSGTDKAKEIRGSVSYKGQKLESGTVRFVSANNEVAFARVQPDGSFIITDVSPGEVKVGVIQGNEPRSVGDSSGKPAAKPTKPPVVLPQKYQDPATSGVTKTVEASTRQLDIDFQ